MTHTKTLFNPDQAAFIRTRYIDISRQSLLSLLNEKFQTHFTLSQLIGFIKRNKLKSGRTGKFRKGHIPALSTKPNGPNKTSFKKGSRPHNFVPIGTERQTTDGYLKIKTGLPNIWTHKHRLVWEITHGPIPKGHVLIFKDNDLTNCVLENLLLISRAELVVMNKSKLNLLTDEWKDTAHLMAKLKIATSRRLNHNT